MRLCKTDTRKLDLDHSCKQKQWMLSIPQTSEYHRDHPGYLWIQGGRISP